MQPLNLGKGTPSSRLKTAWRKSGKQVSFRDFVKAAVAAGTEFMTDANDWLKSKFGKTATKRSEKNIANAKVLAAATKAAKTKKK